MERIFCSDREYCVMEEDSEDTFDIWRQREPVSPDFYSDDLSVETR